MSVTPQTPEDWRDYEADRLMARVIQMRKDLERTHSFKHLIQMQRDHDRSVSEANSDFAPQANTGADYGKVR